MITADQVRKIEPYTVPELLVMIEKKISEAQCMELNHIKFKIERKYQEIDDELIRCGFKVEYEEFLLHHSYYIIEW